MSETTTTTTTTTTKAASVSGMAASIRACTESETFDLGGQTVATITHTIESAFRTPLPLDDMIRITFITGAGKLGRQKYDDGAAKAVTQTLRTIANYEEDRGASCVVECGGSFKLQHDTGKNLKTVVVFPKITGGKQSGGSSSSSAGEPNMNGLTISGSNGGTTTTAHSLIQDDNSPESMIAKSSQVVFERMVASKCPSWSQKKGCLAAMEALKHTLEQLDEVLLSGTPLSDAEQNFYDTVSLQALEEKEAFVRKEMQSQVETGNLTKSEREALLLQVSEKLDKLKHEISESSEKPKKLEKLLALQEKALQRKELLTKIVPKAPHKLRAETEIHKLLTEMAPLQKLEDETKGRLLSVKETQMMGRKVEIEEQVAELEQKSRGWFEDDEAFAERCELSRGSFAAKQKLGKKKTTSSKSASAPTKFILPGQTNRMNGSSWGSKPQVKKTNTKAPGGVFAAMMMDSDSD